MKELFSAAAFCLLATTSYAQTTIKAGTIQLGGGINYSHTTQSYPTYATINGAQTVVSIIDEKNSAFSFSPSAGYFLADNLAVGLSFTYSSTSITRTYANAQFPASEETYRQIYIGPYLKQYKLLTDHFGFTDTLTAGYQHSNSPNSFIIGQSTTKGFYTGLTPGIVFFPIAKLSLDASIGAVSFSSLHTTADNGPDTNEYKRTEFATGFGINQLIFGGTYYFGR